ncbi:MAG TPA: hypothetical protein VH592_25125 [Gemmataceae bacterium]|jgi:hypothetical protein
MTEGEWLACADPQKMLEFLRGKASERKLRLSGCACCRRIWLLLVDQRSRTGVEFAEWFADGEIDDEDRRQASNAAYRAWEDASAVPDDPGEPPDKVLYGSSRLWRKKPYEDDSVARRYLSPHRGIAVFHAAYAVVMATVAAVERVISDSQEAVWFASEQNQRFAVAAEERAQANLLRYVFGPLPFRPVTINPTWLTWNDCTVVKMAQSIYQDRNLPAGTLDPARLHVLADALEEAGCTNQDILGHCRSGGEHVRGCWAVDLLLSKE